jgi:N-acetylglucosaminyldiphosphoundecaprenol N-acetyl-beta-D-mannosaminyltransferase
MNQSVDMQLHRLESVELLGVRIHALALDQLLDIVAQAILARRKALIANVNVHGLNLAYQLPWFRAFLNHADLVYCDGFGVKWGARLLGATIPQRYTPPDWIALLGKLCVEQGFSLFFLGARPGVADKAAARLNELIPSLRIVGTAHGYFDKTYGSAENEAVVEAINAAKPDILVLGFGMPIQERWLLENWERVDATIALPAGAMFDFISGEVFRGPRWMTDHGLEWLSRLVVEPRRLWRRYLIGNPLFLGRVLKQRLGLLHFE